MNIKFESSVLLGSFTTGLMSSGAIASAANVNAEISQSVFNSLNSGEDVYTTEKEKTESEPSKRRKSIEHATSKVRREKPETGKRRTREKPERKTPRVPWSCKATSAIILTAVLLCVRRIAVLNQLRQEELEKLSLDVRAAEISEKCAEEKTEELEKEIKELEDELKEMGEEEIKEPEVQQLKQEALTLEKRERTNIWLGLDDYFSRHEKYRLGVLKRVIEPEGNGYAMTLINAKKVRLDKSDMRKLKIALNISTLKDDLMELDSIIRRDLEVKNTKTAKINSLRGPWNVARYVRENFKPKWD